MKEENKLQIRVKSKTEQRMMEDLDVQMITEWDVKKIAITVCCVLFLTACFGYYLIANQETGGRIIKTSELDEVNKVASAPALKNPTVVKPVSIKKQEPIVTKKQEAIVVKQNTSSVKLNTGKIENNKHIQRGLLAQRTKNKEPNGVVNLPVVVNKEKAISLTYFTEIINMQGNSVYHEWLINNKVIYKKKVNILGDRWRISTRKLFSYTAIGQWQARVVNNKGDILHKIDFLVTK